jgi:hypothetical protein
MILDAKKPIDVDKAKARLSQFINKGAVFTMTEKVNSRTAQQNRALHMFFTIISAQLNELGMEYKYIGLKGQEFSMMHTPDLVKEFVWKPIQIALFKIKSTTKINTKQINDITDVLVKFFGDKGVLIEFPSIESLMNK